MNRSRACFATLAVLALLGVAGCGSGSGDSDDSASAAETSKAATASASPSAQSSPTEDLSEVEGDPGVPDETPIPAAELDWQQVGTWPDGKPAAASSDFVVVLAQGQVTVTGREDEEEILTYSPPFGFAVHQFFLADAALVVVSVDESGEADDTLAVIDLATREQRGVPASAPQPWGGGWSVGSGKVTYGSESSDGKLCLALSELATLQGEITECLTYGDVVNQVSLSPYGVGYGSSDEQGCRTARIRPDGADTQTLTTVPACRVSQVLPVNDGRFLFTTTAELGADTADFFVSGLDGQPEALGSGAAGSLTWCGDAAWFTSADQAKTLRWTAAHGVEQAFAVPDPSLNGALGVPECAGDQVNVTETRDREGGGLDLAVYAAPVASAP